MVNAATDALKSNFVFICWVLVELGFVIQMYCDETRKTNQSPFILTLVGMFKRRK